MELPTRRRLRLRRIVIIVLGVVICVVVALVLRVVVLVSSFDDLTQGITGCEPSQPTQIQQMAHFTFPASATNIESSCTGVQGWIATAQFDMDPSDLDSFVASTRIATLQAQAPISPNALVSGSSDKYLYGEHIGNQSEGFFRQYIYVDVSNPDLYRVSIGATGE